MKSKFLAAAGLVAGLFAAHAACADVLAAHSECMPDNRWHVVTVNLSTGAVVSDEATNQSCIYQAPAAIWRMGSAMAKADSRAKIVSPPPSVWRGPPALRR